MAWRWFHQWGSPRWFYERASRWQAWAGWIAVILLAVGTVWGLAIAPVDYQQGHSYRIIYLHVPVSFLAQALYLAMAIAAAVLLVWRMKLLPFVCWHWPVVRSGGSQPGEPIGCGMRA